MRACYYYCNKTSLCSTTAPKKKLLMQQLYSFQYSPFTVQINEIIYFLLKWRFSPNYSPCQGQTAARWKHYVNSWHQRRWREVKKWSMERCVARVAAGGRQLYSPPRACCFLWLNEHQGHFRADVTVHLAAGVAFHRLIIIDNEGPFEPFGPFLDGSLLLFCKMFCEVCSAWGRFHRLAIEYLPAIVTCCEPICKADCQVESIIIRQPVKEF